MRVSFNPEALAEAEDAARWYRANGGTNPAQEYARELRRVVNLAAAQPGIASPGPHGTSRLYFKRFPYTLIFRIRGEALRVLAIAHQSRRPAYWFERR
jgi:plasmid stabilization system protein ParE